jgi:hypothetical protein
MGFHLTKVGSSGIETPAQSKRHPNATLPEAQVALQHSESKKHM